MDPVDGSGGIYLATCLYVGFRRAVSVRYAASNAVTMQEDDRERAHPREIEDDRDRSPGDREIERQRAGETRHRETGR
jgi:hypothetical protein